MQVSFGCLTNADVEWIVRMEEEKYLGGEEEKRNQRESRLYFPRLWVIPSLFWRV